MMNINIELVEFKNLNSKMDQLKRNERNEERDFANEKLDWFCFENKIRKVIQEIIEPIAKVSLENQSTLEFLKTSTITHKEKIEILEADVIRLDKPPLIYETLQEKVNQNETKFLDFQSYTNNEFSMLKSKAAKCKDDIEELFKEQNESSSKISQLKLDAIKLNSDLRGLINLSVEELKDEIQSMKFTLVSIQECIKSINSQIVQFKDQISFMEGVSEKNFKKIEDSILRIEELENNTIFKTDYKTDIEDIREKTKHSLFCIQDVSKNLDATDNYIEKYLPVKMQELINETLITLSKTDEEKELILDFEVKKYLDFHKVVMKDDGTPGLNKKEFCMPPFSEIERDLKEIRIKNKMKSELNRNESSSSINAQLSPKPTKSEEQASEYFTSKFKIS